MQLRASISKFIRPGAGQLGTYAPRPIRHDQLNDFASHQISDWPTISIVVPTLNQAEYLERTLISIINQGYPNLELVVVDGSSTDHTVEVIKRYEEHISFWVSETDAGQADAINKGFRFTSGEIMAWINSDDLVAPGALCEVARRFAGKAADIIYGDRILINNQDFEIGRWLLPKHSSDVLKWADFVPQETLYWRRECWDAVNGLDTRFQFAMDWDFLLRLSRKGFSIDNCQKVLGCFRVHAHQKTSSLMCSVGAKEIESIRVRELGYVPNKWQIIRRTAPYLLQAKIREISDHFLRSTRARV